MYYTYFAEEVSSNLIKIGRSRTPIKRVKSLSYKLSKKLTLLGVTEEAEKDVHETFSSKRHQGEWFVDCEEIRAYIKKQTRTINEDPEHKKPFKRIYNYIEYKMQWKAKDMAEFFGVSKQRYHQMKNRRSADIDSIFIASDIFDIPSEELFFQIIDGYLRDLK